MIAVRLYLVVLVSIQFFILSLEAREQPSRLQSLEDSLQKVNSEYLFIDLLNELGKEYIFVNPTKAYSYSDSARILSEKISYTKGGASAIRNLGSILGERGFYAKGTEMVFRASELYKEIGDSVGIGNCLISHAFINYRQGLLEKANQYNFSALKIFQSLNLPTRLGVVYNNIAQVYLKKNEIAEAKEYIDQAITINDQLKNLAVLSSAYRILGNIYYEKDKLKPAREAYFKTIQLYEINQQINLEALSEAYLGLARISLRENDLENFTTYAKKSEEISLKHNFFNLYKRILQLRLFAIYKTGEYDQLPDQFQLYLEKEDSVEKALLEDKSYILEKAIQSTKDQAELNFMKKEQVLNRSTIANQKLGIIIISTLFFVLVLLFIWTYSLLLQKKRLVTALDEANNEKIKVFSIVAHDFKSPINTLKGFSELLANNFEMLTKEEVKSTARDIKKSLGNTLKMSENLLTWAKNQLHELSIKPEKFYIKELVEEVISYSQSIIDDKEIKVVQYYGHECFAYADRNQIEVVIRNLLGNAIKFSPMNSEISIKAMCVDDHVIISISDQGNGIPSELSNDLFKISVNSVKGTNGEKGSGLGLVLSSDFVNANNGKIWFNNNQDKGVTFSFELPSIKTKQNS